MKRALAAVFIASLAAGCGKKGPPLPPLVRLPVAPADVVADRRGDTVDLALTVPAANTDGTRPANISRVEVYALTAPVTISDTVVLKDGVRVASVQVKTPKDPNDVADVDDPASDVEAPQGPGVDQGSTAKLHETLTAQSKTPYHAPPAAAAKKATSETRPGPLVGPPLTAPTRLYLALAFNQRGHRGPVAKRVSVPLIDPPARAAAPKVTYTEKSLTLSWEAAAGATHASDTLLPSRSLITTPIKPAFNVYEVAAGGDVKLTSAPITAATFADAHLEWGKERCFAIRSVLLVDNMAIEGERSPSACVTPADTFAPAAPKRPTAIALTAAINILWDANDETDLAGYLVFRGTAPGGPMTKLTPEPIDRTNFTDEVPADFRAFYAIEAVDKAGNASEMSPASDEETAR